MSKKVKLFLNYLFRLKKMLKCYQEDDIMNLKIRGEKLEITNAMKEYASNKINKLSKYL